MEICWNDFHYVVKGVNLVFMKVALLADSAWLVREASTLAHLAIGLTNEQVRVVPVVPLGYELDHLSLVTDKVSYQPSPWRILRGYGIRRSVEALRELDVDVVHALSGTMAWGAVILGRALGVPVVCSCWSSDELDVIARKWASLSGCTFATAGLLDLAKEQYGESDVMELARPGVLVGSGVAQAPLADPSNSLCCLVLSNGRDDYYNLSLLDALAGLGDEMKQVQLFIYTASASKQRLWQAAEKRGLLGQVNFIGGDLATRRLALQADVLIQVQPDGCARSIVLQAMATGRPVVAAADPMIDYLIEGRTARLVTQISAERWAECFSQLVNAPRSFVALGASAKEYVKAEHSAFGFVSVILNMYQTVTGAPIRFESGE